MQRKIGLVILSWFLIFGPVFAETKIVARPVEKDNYVLAISEQEDREADMKIARAKFCLLVCFARELIPNLAHVRRSLRDLFSGEVVTQSALEASILETTPEPIKNVGQRINLLANEFSVSLRNLSKDPYRSAGARLLPKITVSIYQP